MKERALLNYEIIKKINMIGYESTIEREKLASIEPLSSFYFCTNDGEEEAFFNKIIEVSQNVLEINDIPKSLKRLRQLIEIEQLPFEDNQYESSKKTCSSTIVLFDENYHGVNFIMINLPRIFYSTQSIYYSNGQLYTPKTIRYAKAYDINGNLIPPLTSPPINLYNLGYRRYKYRHDISNYQYEIYMHLTNIRNSDIFEKIKSTRNIIDKEVYESIKELFKEVIQKCYDIIKSTEINKIFWLCLLNDLLNEWFRINCIQKQDILNLTYFIILVYQLNLYLKHINYRKIKDICPKVKCKKWSV